MKQPKPFSKKFQNKKKKKQPVGQVSFTSIYSNNPAIEVENTIEQQLVEPEVEEEIEQKIVEENLTETVEEIETTNENIENVEENVENKHKKLAKSKTRFKIFIFGLVGVLVCMIGWAIWNSIEIKTLTAEMEQANKVYSVSVFSHISNLSKADDLTNENSIINLEKLSDAGIIPIQPTPQKKEEFGVKSNWFDRLCNWLSGFFN